MALCRLVCYNRRLNTVLSLVIAQTFNLWSHPCHTSVLSIIHYCKYFLRDRPAVLMVWNLDPFSEVLDRFNLDFFLSLKLQCFSYALWDVFFFDSTHSSFKSYRWMIKHKLKIGWIRMKWMDKNSCWQDNGQSYPLCRWMF